MTIEEKNFLNYFNNRTFNENMFKSDGTLNKNYNSLKKTGTIAQIFEDHWDSLPAETKSLITKY